jgi:hypothetical protein
MARGGAAIRLCRSNTIRICEKVIDRVHPRLVMMSPVKQDVGD